MASKHLDNPFTFTDREYELLQLACRGITSLRAQAGAMHVSQSTVRTLRTAMIGKVPHADNFLDVVLAAIHDTTARADCFPQLGDLEREQLAQVHNMIQVIADTVPILDDWVAIYQHHSELLRQIATRATIERNTRRVKNLAGYAENGAGRGDE